MRLLDRYLLRELLAPLGYCLGGFLLFWLSFDLFAELGKLRDYQLSAGDILLYYAVRVPGIVVEILPVALLLGLLFALSNHARQNEITAMRTAGISLWRVALPYFFVGFVASVGMLALNEFWVPDSEERAEFIKKRHLQQPGWMNSPEVVRQLGFISSKSGVKRTWQIGAYLKSKQEMSDVQVDWEQPNGTHPWLLAKRAIFTNGSWCFFDVTVFQASFDQNTKLAPALVTNVLVLPRFNETPEEIESEISISKRLGIGKFHRVDLPTLEILNYLRLHPDPTESDRRWLLTKLHGRLASAWTCLVVVLIALPFGALPGRRNLLVGVASSISICFLYFVVQRLGMALGTGGWLPPWIAGWLPNFAFGLAGVWMIARAR